MTNTLIYSWNLSINPNTIQGNYYVTDECNHKLNQKYN